MNVRLSIAIGHSASIKRYFIVKAGSWTGSRQAARDGSYPARNRSPLEQHNSFLLKSVSPGKSCQRTAFAMMSFLPPFSSLPNIIKVYVGSTHMYVHPMMLFFVVCGSAVA
jgi:hypothetical protein